MSNEFNLQLPQVLESLEIAVSIIDLDGNCIFANQACLRTLGYELQSELIGKNMHTLAHHTHADGRAYPISECLMHRSVLEGKVAHIDQEVFWNRNGVSFPVEYWAHPLKENGVVVGAVVTFTNITKTVENEAKIVTLSNLYKARCFIDEAIVRVPSEEELFSLACRYSVEHGGMVLAFICKHDDRTHSLYPVERSGVELDYPDLVNATSEADDPMGNGPLGISFRERRPIIVNDYQANKITSPWHKMALNRGLRSAAAFPIMKGGSPYAVISLYNSRINAFDENSIEQFFAMSKSISFAVDNCERVIRQRETAESLRLSAMVYESSSESMVITDANGMILMANKAFTELTGYTANETIGKSINILKSGRQNKEFYASMWNSLNTTGHWDGEIWNRRKNGEVYAERLSINTIYNDDGSVFRRIGLFFDVTKQKESEATIWKQANFDPLTDLPNRNMFLDRLEIEIKKSRRTHFPFALLFIDLDLFKEVNDTLGHQRGDELLRETAQRIKKCVRETDTVARLGGDEFTAILSDIEDPSNVERVSETILQSLAAPYQLGQSMVHISASIGITLYPEDASDVSELLKNADQAMYESKRLGRNRFTYFKHSMQVAAQNRVEIANDLREALDQDQFVVFYQPIVELRTGEIHKAEALIRWQHPQKGLIGPDKFIPIAEETGVIVHIGEWVFQEVARQSAKWETLLKRTMQVSVNKSPVQFNDARRNGSDWVSHLNSLGIKGTSIAVEITEGLLLDANDSIYKQLMQFSDAGIQVSLDDFGTGYSSLAYLKKFDIDYLKIDQSFVRGLAPDSSDLALCEAIIVMAHKLGIKVIAEGIETEDQRNFLMNAHCDYGQGYLYSRPVPADEFEKFVWGGKIKEQDSGNH